MIDLMALRDLPLALAFGFICFWFYNQAQIENAKKLIAQSAEFGKQYDLLLKNYETLVTSLLEERRQWITDSRNERNKLIETLTLNTEAMTKNATEIHALRNALTPRTLGRGRGDAADTRSK